MLIVMGLPGVGKSSILKTALEGRSISVVNYADVILDVVKRKKLSLNRDDIVALPITEHLRLQAAVVARLKDTPRTILDTHAVLKRRPFGYIPGLTPALLKKFTIDGFVFIDAPTSDILERRQTDPARKRPTLAAEDLDEIRRFSLSAISVYSASTAAPVYIITNRKGQMDDAVNRLRQVLDSIGWK